MDACLHKELCTINHFCFCNDSFESFLLLVTVFCFLKGSSAEPAIALAIEVLPLPGTVLPIKS